MFETIENPELFRISIREKINEKLDNEKASINLEKGIFNYSLKEASSKKVLKKWDNKCFIQIYCTHLRTILNNLNDELIQNIKNGLIKASDVAFMTHQDLKPEKWASLIEAKSKREKNKFENVMAAATNSYTCRKCKGNDFTYYLQQVRSADEPMTCYLTCLKCGFRFKTN